MLLSPNTSQNKQLIDSRVNLLIFFISFSTRDLCCLPAKTWLCRETNFWDWTVLWKFWCFCSTKDICGPGCLAETKLNCFSLLSQHGQDKQLIDSLVKMLTCLNSFSTRDFYCLTAKKKTSILTVYHDLNNKVAQERGKKRKKDFTASYFIFVS